MNDDTVSLKEALDILINRGLPRRKAKRLLMKALADGRVPSTAVIVKDGMNLGRQSLPLGFWEGPWRDNEGDKGD